MIILFIIGLISTGVFSSWTWFDYKKKKEQKNFIVTIATLSFLLLILSLVSAIISIIAGISVFFNNVF